MSIGIEKHGVGNWKVISEYITTKSQKQCEDHYWEVYMGRWGYCLPENTIISDEVCPSESKSISRIIVPNEELSNCAIPQVDGHDLFEKGTEVIRDKYKESAKAKDKTDYKERLANMPGADLPGYMPLREDFDVEYENDAENILADMEFFPDDHPTERELKLQVVRIYNNKLDERDKRKRFVIDRGLIDVKRQQNVMIYINFYLIF